MSSLEDEIFEIEKYIKSLELNDNKIKEAVESLKEGIEKGLICNFYNNGSKCTMFSNKVIKQNEYDEFQIYINRCREEDYNKYKEWKNDIIDSGIEFSKDELKYNKFNMI